MATFQIVVSQKDYKILDSDARRLIIEGISSYRRALVLYERLISLQEERSIGNTNYAPGV